MGAVWQGGSKLPGPCSRPLVNALSILGCQARTDRIQSSVVKRYPFNLHIVLWRADDLPGQWLGHCLELDVVSQGNSLRQALEMVKEAIETILVADVQKGLDPARHRAPQEDWDRLWQRLQGAYPRPLAEVATREPAFVVVESVVTVTEVTQQDLAAVRAGANPPPAPPPEFTVGVAFAPADQAA